MEILEAAIIGAGPAGIAAAIQFIRMGVDITLFERKRVGGLLQEARLVQNYPGFARGIPGNELVLFLSSHMERMGKKACMAEVTVLDYDERFLIKTDKGNGIVPAVVIASGTVPKRAEGITIEPGADERLFYEVWPIASVENCTIVIAGAGDAAFDYALRLGRKNNVLIFNRGEKRRCLNLLWHKSSRLSNVQYCRNVEIMRIVPKSCGLLLECRRAEGVDEVYADYVLFAIGREPCVDFISERLKKQSPLLEKQGILQYAGDVRGGRFRQTAIAVGDGVRAAMVVHAALRSSSPTDSRGEEW